METGKLPTRARRFPSSLALWTLWVLASTAGAALAVVATYSVIFIGKRVFGGFDEDRYGSLVLVPAMALLIGAAQWLVLRLRLPRAYWWPIVTAAGWALFVGLMFVVDAAIRPTWTATLTFSILGICIGICQWLYLCRYATSAGWWVAASALGWILLGPIVGRSFTSEGELVLVGLVPSLVTGVALAWLLGRQGGARWQASGWPTSPAP